MMACTPRCPAADEGDAMEPSAQSARTAAVRGHVSRRQLLTGLGVAAAGLPLLAGCGRSAPSPATHEQASERVYRIGWPMEGPPRSGTSLAEWDFPITPANHRLVGRLAELGYIEGRNLRWELRRGLGPDQLAAHAAELAGLGLDLILVISATDALRAAFAAPGTTPVVMGGSSIDPVRDGYAESLAHPGGKVTGVTAAALPGGKRLEVFKEVLPALTRVGFLLDVREGTEAFRESARMQLPSWVAEARALGMDLVVEEFRDLDEADAACAALARTGCGCRCPRSGRAPPGCGP
jgi:hypothetical protein